MLPTDISHTVMHTTLAKDTFLRLAKKACGSRVVQALGLEAWVFWIRDAKRLRATQVSIIKLI